MKTNTEKAIEFLNDCQDDYEELQEEGNNKGILEVIRLLQRGEKYEAIIEKVTREYYGAFVTFGTGTTMEIGEFLGGIEQEVMMEGGE